MSLLIRVREAYQKGINFGAALPDADIGADDTPIDKTITAAKVQGVTDGTHFIVFPHHGLTVRTLNGLKNGTHHVVADQVLAAAKSETAIQQARLRALSTTFNKLFADAKADMLANPARRPATMAALGLDDIGAQATIQALISKIGHNIQPIKGDGTHAGPAVDAATFLSGIKDATIADMNEDATWAALRAAHRDAGVEIARVEKLAELFVAML